VQLFLKIRGSLTRCVKMISRGTTLLQLTEVFQVGAYGAQTPQLILEYM
jgi:hypothetical protein